MKNIFKAFLALAAGLVIAASCTEQTTEPLGTTISASPTELVVADTGASIIGTINIKADGIWFATSSNDDWFTYTPSSGNGDGTITVSLKENVDEYNEVAGPRAGTKSRQRQKAPFFVQICKYGRTRARLVLCFGVFFRTLQPY